MLQMMHVSKLQCHCVRLVVMNRMNGCAYVTNKLMVLILLVLIQKRTCLKHSKNISMKRTLTFSQVGIYLDLILSLFTRGPLSLGVTQNFSKWEN